MRILFISSTRIGDAVLSSGLHDHLLQADPASRFTLACGPLAAPLFRSMPGLERLIVLRKQPRGRHWLRLWRECLGHRWDLIVDIRNTPVSRLLPARQRRVFRKTASPIPMVEQFSRLFAIDPPAAPRLWLDPAALAKAARLLPSDRPILAMAPTASWRGKEWPAARFVAAARHLTGRGGVLEGHRPAVLAAEAERDRAMPVLEGLRGADPIDLIGRTSVADAAACLARSGFFLGNDSGLMHVSAAVGTPTLGVFGPSPDCHYAPWGRHAAFVRSAEPWHVLYARGRADPHAVPSLMDGVAVEEVLAAAATLRARQPPACPRDPYRPPLEKASA